MVRITVELVRKRSEHNEGEISTLEELSLHQEDIEKIENLQNWCRELRILLLQSNLISKIENLHKMKRLEYLNLALNNIELVENLEGCESLQKLDLTLNFVGEITSISSLRENIHLHTLYLTGNPCTEFVGYRDFVIATLPQLQILDSETIFRSDRIKAIQNNNNLSQLINDQQENYKGKRDLQRQENAKKMTEKGKLEQLEDPEEIKKFWDEMCDNSPETRVELANLSRKQRDHESRSQGEDKDLKPTKTFRLFRDNGEPLSINEPRLPFSLNEDDENNTLVLTIEVFRYLDTSLLEADVQPKYVRVTVKGKVFQIVLPETVHPDKSSAQRSQITGHLVIKMPMTKEASFKKGDTVTRQTVSLDPPNCLRPETLSKREFLEIGKADVSMDFSRIEEMMRNHTSKPCVLGYKDLVRRAAEKPVSKYFKENPDVPPLE